jgi:hypothetical protein
MRTAEIRRNLWLELSPQRLIALPLILLVVVLVGEVVSSREHYLGEVGSWLYYGMVLLWGSRRAAAAVTEEVNGGTWIGQRLSALSPSALVLGKLFGATAFIWYGGLIGLALYGFILFDADLPQAYVAAVLLQHLAWGVFVHCVALAASLVLLNKRRLVESVGTTLPQILALLVALAVFGLFWRGPLVVSLVGVGQAISWYGLAFDPALFLTAVAVVFAAWGALACVRLMAAQLQRQLLPWAWPAFVLFLIAFAEGFVPSSPERSVLFSQISAISVALTLYYLALFADRNEPLRFRHCIAAFAGGRLRRGLSLLPWWVYGWFILLAAALWPSGGESAEPDLLGRLAQVFGLTVTDSVLARLGLVCFALRDAAFVLWINAGGRNQRADLVALIYLLVLYGPLVALFIGLEAWTVVGLLAPLPIGPAGLGLASALVQTAVLGFLTWRRWQALFRT